MNCVSLLSRDITTRFFEKWDLVEKASVMSWAVWSCKSKKWIKENQLLRLWKASSEESTADTKRHGAFNVFWKAGKLAPERA